MLSVVFFASGQIDIGLFLFGGALLFSSYAIDPYRVVADKGIVDERSCYDALQAKRTANLLSILALLMFLVGIFIATNN